MTPLQRRLLIAFSVFDLAALTPFVIPFLNTVHLSPPSSVNQFLGGTPIALSTPVAVLVAALLGVVGTGWAIWRWRDPSVRLLRFEGVLRLLFAAWVGATGWMIAAPLLLILAGVDVIAGLTHQFLRGKPALAA